MTKSTVCAARDVALEAVTERLYSPRLPYHNFRHALDTVAAADDIVSRCLEEGIRVDGGVVYFAALFHDAGFHEDHGRLGFATKEEYSVHLAAGILGARGVSPQVIGKVGKAILSTRRDAAFVSVEQKAVRAADLSGLASAYEVFLTNSRNLRLEHEWFTGKTIPWPQWVENSAAVIRFYLTQEIRLTRYFTNTNGESAFHVAVRQNLNRLLAEHG